ncbi:soluble calcium-activated nucleotidase 1 [Tachypleus tridentatus]|uniref:soluble calcium-activated nucleotidase 1 n=1 Tax=Tachypleus tridentatus TaxID=6853 RepID=UPI003FCF02D8
MRTSLSMSALNLEEWRQAVRSPPMYRIGNTTMRMQFNFVGAIVIVGVAFLVVLYTFMPYSKDGFHMTNDFLKHEDHKHNSLSVIEKNYKPSLYYNTTYPLTPPVQTDHGLRFRIAVVSDLDTASKAEQEPYTWISYIKKGFLTIDLAKKSVELKWDKEIIAVKSKLSQEGRGMELSELVFFNGRLLTVDDRTGIIFELISNIAIPWVILTDGDGKNAKGFKCEWATVKDGHLYVGGLGKEWTSPQGELLNYNPQWVKVVSPNGEVQHQDWRDKYVAVRKQAGIDFPGYMIHESVVWSPIYRKWFFLPRRASTTRYDEKDDEKKGTNLMIEANEDFTAINVHTVGPLIPSHGFSSFKFVPETSDTVIIALKSEELEGNISSYVTVFTIDGEILQPETEIGKYKFEGIEFI